MGDVVGFPNPDRGRAHDDAAAREQRRERAKAIREQINRRPKMSRVEQQWVAEALWRLLDRTQIRGVSKATVLRSAGIGSKGDSTKHLAQYAINPAWPQERKDRARLTKNPAPYGKIADAAADLAGWDPDQTLVELFGGTSLVAGSGIRAATPDCEMLAQTLRDVADAVAIKHDLKSLFQKISRAKALLLPLNEEVCGIGGMPLNPEEIDLGFCRSGSLMDWPVVFRESSSEPDTVVDFGGVPPYPALVLGHWPVGDFFPVRIESDEMPRSNEPGPSPFSETTVGQYDVELRLCIVPIGPEMQPECALRVAITCGILPLKKTLTDDEGEQDIEILSFEEIGLSCLPPREPIEVHARVAAGRRLIMCRLSCDEEGIPSVVSAYCTEGHRSVRGRHDVSFYQLWAPFVRIGSVFNRFLIVGSRRARLAYPRAWSGLAFRLQC